MKISSYFRSLNNIDNNKTKASNAYWIFLLLVIIIFVFLVNWFLGVSKNIQEMNNYLGNFTCKNHGGLIKASNSMISCKYKNTNIPDAKKIFGENVCQNAMGLSSYDKVNLNLFSLKNKPASITYYCKDNTKIKFIFNNKS